jgi:hypothetical protein
MDWRAWQSSKKEMGMPVKKGLYYNINKRRKAGLPAKKPGQAGYPTAEAFKRSAKTAKKRRAKR